MTISESSELQSESRRAAALERRRLALTEMQRIVNDEAPVFASMLGVPELRIRLDWGSEETSSEHRVAGIRWDARSKELLVDPDQFLVRDLTSDQAVYAILVEALVNIREALVEPELSDEIARFTRNDEAAEIFWSVFSDLAAGRRAHAVLPRMKAVGAGLYEYLFPEQSFSSETPRHLQFLYKLARDQMIEGSSTEVAPEVEELFDELRNYLSSRSDLLEYSTRHAKSTVEAMTGTERFSIWTRNIYPRWQRLIEIDATDPLVPAPRQQPQTGSRNTRQNSRPRVDFSEFYEQHRTKRRPRAVSQSERSATRKAVNSRAKPRSADPGANLDAQLRRETGHGWNEQRRYVLEVDRFHREIDQIRTLYRSLLGRHLTTRRRLRSGHTEGVVLSPERLAQTAIDIQLGTPDPPVFSDYERYVREHDLSGRSDYVFVFDRSGSMLGEKSAAAASAAVICLEALAALQRDIETAKFETGLNLDLDIRSAVYTFNDSVSIPKPLSHGLTIQQRLDTLADVRSPSGGNADTHVLQAILDLPREQDRKRILIVVSDGEADEPEIARSHVESLRRQGWRVYGLSIGSDAAVRLYAPDSHRVDDPDRVPGIMRQLIERHL